MEKQTWVITGSSTGFGRYLATLLAQKSNINLVATARNIEQLDYLDPYNNGQILKQKLDVTNQKDIVEAITNTIEKFSSIDVLINNAGLGYFGSFEESDLNDAKYMFDVNVWGLVNMTRSVLPIMRNQKKGVIVNFSSIGGLFSFPTLSFYHGTKYAVEGISESISKEVNELGIKVMIVEPSGFRTDWAGRSSKKKLPVFNDYKNLTEMINSMEKGAHHEAGDPEVAAEIIYEQIVNNFSQLPLRLPLGKFSVDTAISKYQSEIELFKRNYDISVSADR